MNSAITKVRIRGFITVFDPDHDRPVAESVGSFVTVLEEIDQSVIEMLGGINLPNAEFYDYVTVGNQEEF